MTALVQSILWNPPELFIFISFYNHQCKIFWYGVLLHEPLQWFMVTCSERHLLFLSLFSYSKMAPELLPSPCLSFELPFQLRIELEVNLLCRFVNELIKKWIRCRWNPSMRDEWIEMLIGQDCWPNDRCCVFSFFLLWTNLKILDRQLKIWTTTPDRHNESGLWTSLRFDISF